MCLHAIDGFHEHRAVLRAVFTQLRRVCEVHDSIGNDAGRHMRWTVRRGMIVQDRLHDPHPPGRADVEALAAPCGRPPSSSPSRIVARAREDASRPPREDRGGRRATPAPAKPTWQRRKSSHPASTSSTRSTWIRTSPTRTASRRPTLRSARNRVLKECEASNAHAPRFDFELVPQRVVCEKSQSCDLTDPAQFVECSHLHILASVDQIT